MKKVIVLIFLMVIACSLSRCGRADSARVNEAINSNGGLTQPGHSEPEPAQAAQSQPVNVLMVIAPDAYRDEELFIPKGMFEQSGARITLASTTTDTCVGMLGGAANPDIKISEAKADDYHVIVIVGGVGAEKYLWDNLDLRKLVIDAYKKNKVLAAICLAPAVLAKAGILKDVKATVYPDEDAIGALKKGGAAYRDENVIVSGRLVTARDPNSAKEFAHEVISFFK